jgi:preprotein translocase subunit SecB
MAKKKKEISLESAVKVSDRIDLQSVKLLDCNCRLKPNYPDGQKAFDMDTNSRFEVDKEKNIIGVFIGFTLNAFGKEADHKKENSFLNVEATFLLLYKISNIEGLDDLAFTSFAEINGVYNAWPYWREFVQSTSSRMGLPPLTVPVFRIAPKPTKIDTKKDEASVKVKM